MDNAEAIPHRPEADSFDVAAALRRVIESTLRHKWQVMFTTLLTLSLVVAYLLIWPPVYSASALVLSEGPEDIQRDQFYASWNVFRKDELNSEVQLMTSVPVLRQVTSELGLKYDDIYHPIMSHAAYLWTESWPGKKYRAIKEAVFPPRKGLYDPTPDQIEMARVLNDFKAGVGLEPVADSHVGQLTVRGPSPRVAEIANRIVKTYLDQRQRRHVDEAKHACASLTVEMDKAKRDVETMADQKLLYYSQNGLLLEFEKDKVEVAKWIEMQSGVLDLEAALASMLKTKDAVSNLLGKEDKQFISARTFQKNALRETLKASALEMQTQLSSALLRFRPDSREVTELHKQIATVQRLIDDQPDTVDYSHIQAASTSYENLRVRLASIDTDLAGTAAMLGVKKKALDDMTGLVNRLPEKMNVAHVLNRDYTALETKYALIREKLMQAQVSMATAISAPPSLKIEDWATPPSEPGWPNKKLLLGLALLVGAMAGIGLAVLTDSLQSRVTSGRLSSKNGGLPLYATLELSDLAALRRRDLSPARLVVAGVGNGNGHGNGHGNGNGNGNGHGNGHGNGKHHHKHGSTN